MNLEPTGKHEPKQWYQSLNFQYYQCFAFWGGLACKLNARNLRACLVTKLSRVKLPAGPTKHPFILAETCVREYREPRRILCGLHAIMIFFNLDANKHYHMEKLSWRDVVRFRMGYSFKKQTLSPLGQKENKSEFSFDYVWVHKNNANTAIGTFWVRIWVFTLFWEKIRKFCRLPKKLQNTLRTILKVVGYSNDYSKKFTAKKKFNFLVNIHGQTRLLTYPFNKYLLRQLYHMCSDYFNPYKDHYSLIEYRLRDFELYISGTLIPLGIFIYMSLSNDLYKYIVTTSIRRMFSLSETIKVIK